MTTLELEKEQTVKPVLNETIVRQLNWRYATKRFDPARKVQAPDWRTLEQALVLAPSSYGLQPWAFFNVTDAGLRQRVRAAAWDQSQVTDASHLVVFAVRDNFGPEDVHRLIRRVAGVRGVPVESLDGYRDMMLAAVNNRSPDEVRAWTGRQVYIALGNFLGTAALLGIDACPMEGFDPAKVDQILKLPDRGYRALAMVAVGYRHPEDRSAQLRKVRYTPDEVVVTL